jgi:hypothetical protein
VCSQKSRISVRAPTTGGELDRQARALAAVVKARDRLALWALVEMDAVGMSGEAAEAIAEVANHRMSFFGECNLVSTIIGIIPKTKFLSLP